MHCCTHTDTDKQSFILYIPALIHSRRCLYASNSTLVQHHDARQSIYFCSHDDTIASAIERSIIAIIVDIAGSHIDCCFPRIDVCMSMIDMKTMITATFDGRQSCLQSMGWTGDCHRPVYTKNVCVFVCVVRLNYVVSTIRRHIVFTSSDQVTAFIGLTVA